jgi:hypothetical protein
VRTLAFILVVAAGVALARVSGFGDWCERQGMLAARRIIDRRGRS